jgi:serine/threonine protein kinase
LHQEINLQKATEHPNVIKLFKVYQEPHKLHLLLEYASQGTLYQYIKRNNKLTDAQILFVFKQICFGVLELHKKNILHRDIKPENILLDENFIPKLADFGFACTIKKDERRRTICGTREYFSPEIWTHKNQSLKLDIWCLGVLLFELCHNRAPFKFIQKSFEKEAMMLKGEAHV